MSWKKLAGHQSNQLLGVVTKLDEQVQSVTNMAQKSSRLADVTKLKKKKYYRLESEEKPVFPLQQKNFYSHVMENKEIMKTLSLLSTCTQNVKIVSMFSIYNRDNIKLFIKLNKKKLSNSFQRCRECVVSLLTEAFILCCYCEKVMLIIPGNFRN